MTIDEHIADIRSKAAGRTRHEGQSSYRDEVLADEIGRLLGGIKEAADYLDKNRPGDASFTLAALQAK